ncbi:beta-N-acetylhexosaminidase, partial [Pontibacter sp. HJ8]
MTFTKKIFTLILCVFCTVGAANLAQAQTAASAQALSLIPQPVKLTTQQGSFALLADTKIYVDPKNEELQRVGQFLAQDIQQASGIKPEVLQKKPKKNATNLIYLTLHGSSDTLGTEGYTLSVKPARITLAAHKANGIFLGTQTIRQLLPASKTAAAVTIPALEIVDKPRYQWRGLHLDVTRHFQPVEFVKKYIDYLAMHKLNTFHWHLTDDQGWRIEIK